MSKPLSSPAWFGVHVPLSGSPTRYRPSTKRNPPRFIDFTGISNTRAAAAGTTDEMFFDIDDGDDDDLDDRSPSSSQLLFPFFLPKPKRPPPYSDVRVVRIMVVICMPLLSRLARILSADGENARIVEESRSRMSTFGHIAEVWFMVDQLLI
jgi:hypothetical protein